jgi:Response regulator receiver domain
MELGRACGITFGGEVMSAQAAVESQAVATTILVVEDEIFVRLDIAEILRNASFRVVEAGTADEVLAVLNSAYPVDALMTDIRMPGSIDGINLAARVPKKAIADYKKAIGKLEGLVELSIFYCEEAFSFIESCGMEEESYFLALIHIYDQALRLVSNLPPDIRINYVDRLDKPRSRGRHVGWGVEDELNSLWFAADICESPGD